MAYLLVLLALDLVAAHLVLLVDQNLLAAVPLMVDLVAFLLHSSSLHFILWPWHLLVVLIASPCWHLLIALLLVVLVMNLMAADLVLLVVDLVAAVAFMVELVAAFPFMVELMAAFLQPSPLPFILWPRHLLVVLMASSCWHLLISFDFSGQLSFYLLMAADLLFLAPGCSFPALVN